MRRTKQIKRLPAEPLLARFKGVYHQDIATFFGAKTRAAVRHWQQNGFSIKQADRMAIRMGLHPYEIWGEEWFR